jgi:ribonucleoside-diphosphate reductase alpha chain
VSVTARRRLPDERNSLAMHFSILDKDGVEHDGYVHVGLYEDGQPGELFVTMAKAHPSVGPLLDQLGIAVSIGLQHGVALAFYCDKYVGSKYEPSGSTNSKSFPRCTSPTDLVFRLLRERFVDAGAEAAAELPKELAS